VVECCKQETINYFSDPFLNVLYVGVPTEPCCDPVLIVGAGLSAADAVIAARFRSLPILHVFRKKAAALGTGSTQLPENMYPEYHKVSAGKVV
jgi:hypothetical protein